MRLRITALLFATLMCAKIASASPIMPLAATAFPAPVPQYLVTLINDAAKKYGVDPNLIAAMTFRESAFNTNAVSSRGAQGLMQLMPKTARALGVQNAFDAQQNIFGGTKYVKSLLDRFHWIIYPFAALAGGNAERARSYLEFLQRPPARALFEKQGFTVLTGGS